MTVEEFERAVWQIEGVRIRIRAPVETAIGDYSYARQAAQNTTVSGWCETRLYPRLKDHQVSILDGAFNYPHGLTRMDTLRESYTGSS